MLAKLPFAAAERIAWCGKADCRHLRLRLPGDIELHNLCVPAGGDEPEQETNPKFRHKLEILAALSDWSRRELAAERRAFLVGDLNIASLKIEVWNHRALLKVVSHTPVEVTALRELQASHTGSTRSAGSFHPQSGSRLGGAIVPATEKRPIAAAGSTTSD